MPRLFPCLLPVLFLVAGCDEEPGAEAAPSEPIPALRQVDPAVDIYTGGEPLEPDGYKTLRTLGIQSVIDVDATPPRPGSTDGFEGGVVHLPLKYSGITPEEAGALTALITSLPRPIFVHCHHGTNRAPAAVAVALIGSGEWTPEQGMALLEISGTEPGFNGLHEAVETAIEIAPSDRLLLPVTRDEHVEFAELMGDVDRQWTLLEEGAASGWSSPDAAADAAELVDQLRRAFMASTIEEQAYIQLAEQALMESRDLEDALLAGRRDLALNRYSALGTTCSACHEGYRD